MKESISKAIFGGFDGTTCVLGVIAGLAHDPHALIVAAAGLAVTETIGMASGSYISEVANVSSVRHAVIIGVAACIGVLLPALPFLFLHGFAALIACGLVTCALAIVIAQARVSSDGWLRAYMQTFAILIAVSAVAILVTLALNGVGA